MISFKFMEKNYLKRIWISAVIPLGSQNIEKVWATGTAEKNLFLTTYEPLGKLNWKDHHWQQLCSQQEQPMRELERWLVRCIASKKWFLSSLYGNVYLQRAKAVQAGFSQMLAIQQIRSWDIGIPVLSPQHGIQIWKEKKCSPGLHGIKVMYRLEKQMPVSF